MTRIAYSMYTDFKKFECNSYYIHDEALARWHVIKLIEGSRDPYVVTKYRHNQFVEDFLIAGPKKKFKPISKTETSMQINQLLEWGGRLSGGGGLEILHNILGISEPNYPIKDLDIYFNNEYYILAKALTHKNVGIDVCGYRAFPFERHDITPVMYAIADKGQVHITDVCKEAWLTKIGRINHQSIGAVNRTLARLVKYSNRYGFKWLIADILGLAAFNPDDKIFSDTISALKDKYLV